jgi:hypothetical protein
MFSFFHFRDGIGLRKMALRKFTNAASRRRRENKKVVRARTGKLTVTLCGASSFLFRSIREFLAIFLEP